MSAASRPRRNFVLSFYIMESKWRAHLWEGRCKCIEGRSGLEIPFSKLQMLLNTPSPLDKHQSSILRATNLYHCLVFVFIRQPTTHPYSTRREKPARNASSDKTQHGDDEISFFQSSFSNGSTHNNSNVPLLHS